MSYATMRDIRTPDEIEADQLALPSLVPGATVRHCSRRDWIAVVLRTFVDSSGEWVEYQDNRGNRGAGRPRHWEIVS